MKVSKTRIKEVEWAFDQMKSRKWGFVSNGFGFGDPHATFTMIGPYDGTLVEVYASDKDCVIAVKKAIVKSERIEEWNAKQP